MKDIFIYAIIIVNLIVIFNYNNYVKEENISKVEIKGYVNEPGVYEIKSNSYVEDIINKAGGLKENANISSINLARKLVDEDVIVIYSNEEIENMKDDSSIIKYIDKECVCPIIDNKALFNKVITNADGLIISTGKVSLNSASIKELMTLPSIGESKAKLIISYRDSNNGFKEVTEIMNVKGIGEGVFEKIKDYLTL